MVMLRKVKGHILRREFKFDAEGKWKKYRLNRTWKREYKEESMKSGVCREDVFADHSGLLTLVRR